MTTFLIILMLLLCVFMVMVVLVQRGRGGGLSGAFGSGGGSSSAFGTKTGDVFTMITVIAFVLFMLMSIWLSFRFKDKTAVVATAPVVSAPVTGLPMTGLPMPENKPATTSAPGKMAATSSMPAAATTRQ